MRDGCTSECRPTRQPLIFGVEKATAFFVSSSFFCLHVIEFEPRDTVLPKQPTSPGLRQRGRPRSVFSRAERMRRTQAERRKGGSRKPLSVEVEKILFSTFKTKAYFCGLTLREAVEEAMCAWVNSSSSGGAQGCVSHEDR